MNQNNYNLFDNSPGNEADSQEFEKLSQGIDISAKEYEQFDDPLLPTKAALEKSAIISTDNTPITKQVVIPAEEPEDDMDKWHEPQRPTTNNAIENLSGETLPTQPTIAVGATNTPNNEVAATTITNPPRSANTSFNTNLPGQGGGVMSLLKKEGKWDKRLVIGGLLVGIFVLSSYVSNAISSKNKGKESEKSKPLQIRSEEVKPRINNTDINNGELNPVSQAYNDVPKGPPPIKMPETLPTPLPVATPKPVVLPGSEPPKVKEIALEQQDFGILLHAEAANVERKKSDKNKADEGKEKTISLKGLRISMVLLEPFRSGIPSPITAQVISSVKDASGKIIIPAYSTVQIPLNGAEINGRVVNDTGANALVKLPNGEELTIKGFIKGADGYTGLAGKVIGKKANVLARTGRATLKALGTLVGIQTGGIGGAVATESINQSIDTTLPYLPSQRVVEIAAGTTFTFNVIN